MRKINIFLFAWLLSYLLTSLFPGFDVKAQQLELSRGIEFEKMAAELLKQLSWNFTTSKVCARLGSSDKTFQGYCSSANTKGNRIIAVQPFQEDDVPLPLTLAREFNVHLQQALFKISRGAYTFVARDNIENIIADKEAMGTLDEGPTNFIDKLLKKNSKIDILIIGRINVKRKSAFLNYDAQGMDGQKYASTTGFIRLTPEELEGEVESLPHHIAIKRLAKEIKISAPDMMSVSQCGIKYAGTHYQPPFGRWISNKLAVNLVRVYRDVMTGKRLKIDKDCKRQAQSKSGQHFRLAGSYWEFPDRINLIVTLNGGSPTNTSIKRTPSLPRLKPRGRSFDDYVKNDGVGPFIFELDTDRGRHPVYQIMEPTQEIKLKFRSARNASIYCFDIDKNLAVRQLFPNEYFNKAKGINILKRDTWHSLSDGEWGFQYYASPPAGKSLIKCFAATRDIKNDLPRELWGLSFDPVPKNISRKLVQTFAEVPRVAISEASVLLTTVLPRPRPGRRSFDDYVN